MREDAVPPPDDRITRREYEQRWRDHLRVHDAEERARTSALNSIDSRLAGMNEFRDSIDDTTNTMLTKVEFNAWREGMAQQQRWMVTTLLGLAVFLLALVGFLATHHG